MDEPRVILSDPKRVQRNDTRGFAYEFLFTQESATRGRGVPPARGKLLVEISRSAAGPAARSASLDEVDAATVGKLDLESKLRHVGHLDPEERVVVDSKSPYVQLLPSKRNQR